jgi:hypothetical protein
MAWVCKRPDYKARVQASMEWLGWFVCKQVRNAEPLREVYLGHVPADGILHSQRRENLKSYMASTDWTL